MRPASDIPPPRGRRGFSRRIRVVIAIAIVALIILTLSLRGIAGFYTDYLWFDSLGYSSVWRGVLVAQVLLALVFILFMFVLLWVNLYLADRIAPSFRPPGPEEEFVKRYHDTVGARAGLVRIGVAGLFALFWGAGAGSRWQDWILYRNGVDFGLEDAQFGVDIGFYVFELPFIRFFINWLFTAFVVVLIITAAAHYMNGGIRVNAPVQRVTPQVKAHLSVLLAILALVKAVDYWYQRYSLNFSNRGFVGGASYTDVNAQLPAIKLLILISLAAALLLIVNIFRRGWVLPVVAVGLWAFVAIVMGNIYPAIYQRLVVEPNELAREEEFIQRNIDATRLAYGFNTVGPEGQILRTPTPVFSFNPEDENLAPLSPEFLRANTDTIENVRLLDPAIVSPTFSRREVERDQFRFADDLDVDRYRIDGEDRLVVVAARELNLSGVQSGWENQHVASTHGYGLAIAPANKITAEGEPDFLVGSLPTTIDASIDVGLSEDETLQPRIYIGEGLSGYAIVGANDRCEVDFPLEGGAVPDLEDTVDAPADGEGLTGLECGVRGSNQEFAYDGEDGVEAGGFIRRVAFALRFQDLNPIVSGLIDDDSRFIFNRDVQTRVRELAPFLDFDADSYPAIIDGRVVFIVDAYTTSDNYPYSQNADRSSLPAGSDLRGSFNYVRNSVKAVVDAYNGSVDFYVVDETDPIIQAYQKAFPDLFKSRDNEGFTAELISHLRYPEDMFRIQTNMWASYQLDSAASLFDNVAAWSVALDPGDDLVESDSITTGADGLQIRTSGDRIPPYYLQMRLPGETEQEFVLTRPFVPRSITEGTLRQELTAFMVGRIDETGNQSLVSYRLNGTSVDGPVLANATMLNDPAIARQTTLLGQQGSSVRLGNMVMLPLETDDGDERIVYVRPLYVDTQEGQGGLPILRFVIVSYDDVVRMCPTLELALGALFVDSSDLDAENCSGVVSPLSGETIVIDDANPPGSIDTPDSDPEIEPAPTPTPSPTPVPEPTPTPVPVEPPPADVQTLLQQAQEAFDAADEALAEGDLGRYQELIDEGQRLLDDALSRIAAAEAAEPDEPDQGGEGESDTDGTEPTPTPTPEGA